MGDIHINSFKSVQIEILSQETNEHLTWATGFICMFQKRYFLVTNWHVVSGKNFETKTVLHKSGAIPGFLNLYFNSGQNKTDTTLEPVSYKISNLPLYDLSIENHRILYGVKPFWIEHPDFKSDIDVVVIEITDMIINNEKTTTIGYNIEKELMEINNLNVMDEVFIIGFPLKSTTTPNSFPIHKNATIASEPNIFKNKPLFYIDGKTKSGMSGSPVVKRSRSEFYKEGFNVIHNEGKVSLIGVYSGRERQAKDEYEAELGIVWKFKECVLPILNAAVKADIPNNSLLKQINKVLAQSE